MPNLDCTSDCRSIDQLKHQLTRSSIDAKVQELSDALRRELVPTSAIERTAIEDYIHVECQRERLRHVRNQIERSFAMGHIWTLLSRAIVQLNPCNSIDGEQAGQLAEQIVRKFANGDTDAQSEILRHGIDIDEALSLCVASRLPELMELERERDRLAKRARLLLEDIERAQKFGRSRKLADIQDAELLN
jgi:hypothetical protein